MKTINSQKNVGVLYKFVLLLILCCNLATIKVSAQFYLEESFPSYSSFLSKVMDMDWKIPHGFNWEELGSTLWTQGDWGQKGSGSIYIGSMKSEDENCLILYPEYSSVMLGSFKDTLNLPGDISLVRRQLVYDMRDALKKEIPLNAISSDLGQYVITLVGRKTPFNADTVFVAQIPLKENYQDKYKYCTGIYAYKQGRPSITFKCFFTEEGKLNEKKYLDDFYRSIKYRRNKNWSYDHDRSLKIIIDMSPKVHK